jgi:mRNA interferase MazF
VVIVRGGIYWVDLATPIRSRPVKRRPVLVISADSYNTSRLATVLATVITSNTRLAAMPGNVFLPAATTGLPRDSVADVTAIVTLDKSELSEAVGTLTGNLLADVDLGLGRVLNLSRVAAR